MADQSSPSLLESGTTSEKLVKNGGRVPERQSAPSQPASRVRSVGRAMGTSPPALQQCDFRRPRAGEAPQPSFMSFNILLVPVVVFPGSPPQKGPPFSPPGISCTKVVIAQLPGIRAGYRLETCRFLFRWKDMATRGDKSAKILANGLERRSSWLI